MTAICDYIHDVSFGDLSPEAVTTLKRAILDTSGVAIAGAGTQASRIMRDHAARHFGGGRSRMLRDGRVVSAPGAALAGGMTIDALDAHDGHKLTKGHVACGVMPSALALLDHQGRSDSREFLAMMALGYEIGTRAGIGLHRTACDYHTSGAWVAVACAALGARALGLDTRRTREALGIAEYHGPRSQMMRCIDHPTMVKDGSGWGAMAGVSAAFLADDGFTGAPAVTLEAYDVADIWGDLGQRQYLFDQYMKLFPVCRWAQPPVQAVLDLRSAHGLASGDIERIEVATFHESRRLAVRHPQTTEQAQYSTAYPVAVAMVRGGVRAEDMAEAAFADPEVRRLAASMAFAEEEAYDAAFPARRLADVTLHLRDGRRLRSSATEARGDPEAPLSDAQVVAKFHSLADPVIGEARAVQARREIDGLDQAHSLEAVSDALFRV